jgi:hypothetical protein
MPYHRPLLVAVLLAAGVVTLPGIPVQAAGSASLKTVCLGRSDLPSGFALSQAKYVSNAQMAKAVNVPAAQFKKHGRINGYEELFVKHTLKGVNSVGCAIYQYSSAAGSLWDFQHSVSQDLTRAKRTSGPKLGDASITMTTTQGSGSQKLRFFLIDFHKGKYDLSLGISGYSRITVNDAARYANVLLSRAK